MKSTFEIRSAFDRLLNELSQQTRKELSISYGYNSPLHGMIDVVIRKNGQCMAVGRFKKVDEEGHSDFAERFRIAMGYPDDTWYLFGYDGKKMVINDLSLSDPIDDFPSCAEEGLRRLIMLPEEWHAEQKKLQDMKNFLEAMRDLIDEEALSNPVN